LSFESFPDELSCSITKVEDALEFLGILGNFSANFEVSYPVDLAEINNTPIEINIHSVSVDVLQFLNLPIDNDE